MVIGVGDPAEQIGEGGKVPRAVGLEVIEGIERLAKRRVLRRLGSIEAQPRAQRLHGFDCSSIRDGVNSKGLGMISRRDFVANAAATAAAITIVPRHVLGRGFTPPSDKLNIAAVGVGGMGKSNILNVASQNVVAFCDVDWDYAGRALDNPDGDLERLQGRLAQAPTDAARTQIQDQIDGTRMLKDQLSKATRYRDFREMLGKQKDIDAVIIATPDHLHATIAMAAMDLGKHVYVQKPLTWSIQEARQLAAKAKQTKVATQMGNQGHSWDDARKAVEYVWAGAIGDVREVHVWTNRPLTHWPQGIPRPQPLTTRSEELRWNMAGVMQRLAGAMAGSYPVPDTLSWDLFLGPAPYVEYHPVYHPFNWRGWVDWGVGAIGDMGAHLIDHPYWALDLGYPTTVETVSTPFDKTCHPAATTTYYEFPARGSKPPVKLTWYDGGLLPPKPVEMGEEKLNPTGGVLFIGSKGKLMHDTYGLNPRLLPKSLHDSYGTPAKKLPRMAMSHEMNWVEAAKGKTEASCPFEYAARLTEVMLLGVVSLRAGGKIYYDGPAMRVTNNLPGANDYFGREYRTGWSL
jgi:predicted dehydrogenase